MNTDEPTGKSQLPIKITRRDVLGRATALGVAGSVGSAAEAATSEGRAPADGHKVDPALAREMRESSVFLLADEVLDEKRLAAMRHLLETNLKEIELLRQFDPDDEEPVTRFRPW